jgi:putative drug exporter of the RND superfamily
MNMARALIRLPGGRRTKWAVLILWLLVVAVAGPLAGKLTGAEKNDAQSWLPGRAESSQVLRLQSKFQSPNIYSAVVVYVRQPGLTAGDRHKALGDAAGFRAVRGAASGQVAGP